MDKKIFKRILENIAFAMNLSDDIPEHIMTEMMRSKDKRVASELEAIFGKFDRSESDFESIEDFNAEVDRKLRPRLGQQLQSKQPSPHPEKEFFSEIVGYSDIKKLLMKCILSDSVHVILEGPPASAKSLFLYEMEKNLDRVYFVDCTNTTGPGLVDYLFRNDVKYLLLDEVEKMSYNDQNVLLNVLETGVLTSIKVKKTGSKKLDMSVYATTNNIDEISKPFRSRFLEFSLPPYTYNEFCDIAVKLTQQRDGHDRETAMKIADTVWNKLGSRDVRDIIQISKLTKSMGDIEFVATIIQRYKKKNDPE